MKTLRYIAVVGMFLCTAAKDTSRLCFEKGRMAYVTQRSQADIRVRYVDHGEDARLRFRTYPANPGEWRVVGHNEPHDIKVFIEHRSGPDIVDVRVVKYGAQCM